jgi:hypothetical protein
MFVGDERLDAARRAHEQRHDDDASEHEQLVKQARADRAEPQQSGDRPTAGERSACGAAAASWSCSRRRTFLETGA